jgi:RNA recognition motif-containing protein
VERIYFGNLSFDTKIETMLELFEKHGKVINLFINEDFATQQSRGYGFCQMSKEEAPAAITALNGMEVDGRTIRVTVSEDKVDKLKIYCGSLSFDTTEETVREVFAEYGEVFSIYLPDDKQYGGSRGFAIVTMDKEGGAKAILGVDNLEVDGRNLRVNEAKPKGAATTTTSKIYIGNLDFDTTEDTIMDAFAEYGEVKECILPEDRDFGGSRGFGFVVMDAEDSKSAIDELDGIELDGRVIRVVEADGGKRGGRSGGDDSPAEESFDEAE